MNHDRAQSALSERMDGERLKPSAARALEEHLETCSRCRAFESNAAHLRAAVRIRTAEEVPDLTARILAALPATPRSVWRPKRSRPPSAWIAAALVIGIIAGSLSVGGPFQRPTSTPVAVADIVRGVRAAADDLNSYHASFAISERGLSALVPERSLSMNVWFSAPGRFRLDVTDSTAYPSDSWTPTDLSFVSDGAVAYTTGPSGCPAALAVELCPPTRAVTQERTAFSTEAPLPADLILPLDTLGSSRGITALGAGTVLSRPAIRVQMTFDRAQPLFPFLRLGGTWRPFFSEDRVVVWLDANSWFPLRYSVFPSADPARRDWELRFGITEEQPDRQIFGVTATSLQTQSPPAADVFAIPGGTGTGAVSIPAIPSRVGFQPATPTATQGLELTSAVVPTSDAPGGPQVLLTYSSGLSYLKVGERRGGRGEVAVGSERVPIPGGGVAYYEPASDTRGRRVSIHTSTGDIVLESNLSREGLIDVAASIPVKGLPLPSDSARLTKDQAGRIAPFALAATLPEGYSFTSAARTLADGVRGVTIYFGQPNSDVEGPQIAIHIERSNALPAVAAADLSTLSIPGHGQARWTPGSGRLEWIDSGRYISLEAPGWQLNDLLAIATAMKAAA